MEEPVLKQKYQYLKIELNKIKDALLNLDIIYNKVNATTKETLLINNNINLEQPFKSIKDNSDKVILDLRNNIIPKINNKI